MRDLIYNLKNIPFLKIYIFLSNFYTLSQILSVNYSNDAKIIDKRKFVKATKFLNTYVTLVHPNIFKQN